MSCFPLARRLFRGSQNGSWCRQLVSESFQPSLQCADLSDRHAVLVSKETNTIDQKGARLRSSAGNQCCDSVWVSIGKRRMRMAPGHGTPRPAAPDEPALNTAHAFVWRDACGATAHDRVARTVLPMNEPFMREAQMDSRLIFKVLAYVAFVVVFLLTIGGPADRGSQWARRGDADVARLQTASQIGFGKRGFETLWRERIQRRCGDPEPTHMETLC